MKCLPSAIHITPGEARDWGLSSVWPACSGDATSYGAASCNVYCIVATGPVRLAASGGTVGELAVPTILANATAALTPKYGPVDLSYQAVDRYCPTMSETTYSHMTLCTC